VKDPLRGWKEIIKPFQPGVPWISTASLGVSAGALAGGSP
jgi:hypothetical protein